MRSLDRDLTTISHQLLFSQVDELCTTADTLAAEQPNFETEILTRKEKILHNWAEIQEITQERRKRLQLHYELQLFISLHDNCVDWIREKTREIEDEPLATTTVGAMELLSGLENTHLVSHSERHSLYRKVKSLKYRNLIA